MSLERHLKQEQVSHLDLSAYVSVETGTPVRTVLRRMRHRRSGCALVHDRGTLCGIFTERDVLRKCTASPQVLNQPIEELMTPDPQVVRPDDEVGNALRLMNERRFRNVPVVGEDGRVLGNLTHYAIIHFLCDRFPEGIYNLPPDPEQVAKTRDGA